MNTPSNQSDETNQSPNFVLVDENLYTQFKLFLSRFAAEQLTPQPTDTPISVLPDNQSDFVLIDNQTGRIIR